MYFKYTQTKQKILYNLNNNFTEVYIKYFNSSGVKNIFLLYMLFSIIYCIAHFVILNTCDMETVDMFIDNSKYYSQEIKKF